MGDMGAELGTERETKMKRIVNLAVKYILYTYWYFFFYKLITKVKGIESSSYSIKYLHIYIYIVLTGSGSKYLIYTYIERLKH